MLAVDTVLLRLGDGVQLSDIGYREQLARQVVSTLRSLIEGIHDPTDRRIAEAVLASKPEFYEKTVDQRRAYVREHDLGFTDDQFKTRRARVINDLAADLAEAFEDQPPSAQRIFVGGNCRDPVWDRDATELGVALADLPVTVVTGSARPGRLIAYALADALVTKGKYLPSRVMLFAHANPKRPTQADRPLGTLTYFGATAHEKRCEMLRISNLAIMFGGGQGTKEEAELAESRGIPVIPLAFTGGAARQYWLSHRDSVNTMCLGGRQVDVQLYEALDHGVHSLALQAAMRLIRQSLGFS
jgi:hypothetical protein